MSKRERIASLNTIINKKELLLATLTASPYFEMTFVDVVLGFGGVNLRIIPAYRAHNCFSAESMQIATAKSQGFRCQICQEFLCWFLLPTFYVHLHRRKLIVFLSLLLLRVTLDITRCPEIILKESSSSKYLGHIQDTFRMTPGYPVLLELSLAIPRVSLSWRCNKAKGNTALCRIYRASSERDLSRRFYWSRLSL